MSWFECPGCDKIVTGLVCGTGPKDDNSYYSKTHCCLQCERGEGSQSSDVWACPAIPKGSFRATALPSCDVPAHYILHLPETAGALPTIFFLHGGVTYIYPESLWCDVQHLVARNPVVRKRFIVIAPFAAIGEPIATFSGCCTWPKFDWNDVNAEDTVLKELEHLFICSYNGEEDRSTYSWRDFTWLAAKRASVHKTNKLTKPTVQIGNGWSAADKQAPPPTTIRSRRCCDETMQMRKRKRKRKR